MERPSVHVAIALLGELPEWGALAAAQAAVAAALPKREGLKHRSDEDLRGGARILEELERLGFPDAALYRDRIMCELMHRSIDVNVGEQEA